MSVVIRILWITSVLLSITVTANSYTISAQSTFQSYGPSVVNYETANNGSVYTSVSHEDSIAGGVAGTGYANAYADSSGVLNISTEAQQSGYDGMSISAMSSYETSFTNNSSYDLSYNFNFGLFGELTASGSKSATVQPNFLAEISINDSLIWDSYTSIWFDNWAYDFRVDDTNPDVNQTIVNESTYAEYLHWVDEGTYDIIQDLETLDVKLISSYNGLLSLGNIAPRESFYLKYNIFARPSGMDSGYASSSGSMWGQVSSTPVAPVPEPSTFLLLGSGIAGFLGYSRKRKIL